VNDSNRIGPRLAAGMGIVAAIVLTALVWVILIDSQAQAMLPDTEPQAGTPAAVSEAGDYESAGASEGSRPIP
jgi:hypothetical protein